MSLLRKEHAKPIESQSRTQRQPTVHSPQITRVSTVRPQAVFRHRGRLEQINLRRIAVAQHVQDVAWITLSPDVGQRRAERLATGLEMVVAEPAILEVADGPEHLVATPVLLPVTISALDDGRDDILEARGRAVRRLGPVGPKLSDTDIEEHSLIDDGVPLGFPNPSRGA